MAELTFTDVLDFLSDHEGKAVYIEIGTKDREAEHPGDSFVLKLHKFKVGKIKNSIDESGERKAPTVMLERVDGPAGGEGDDISRLFINPRQVTRVEGTPSGPGLKVWIDDAFYIGLIAG